MNELLTLNCDFSRVEQTVQLSCNISQFPTFGTTTDNKLNYSNHEDNITAFRIRVICVTIKKLEVSFFVQSMMGLQENIYAITTIVKVENIYPTGLLVSKFKLCSVRQSTKSNQISSGISVNGVNDFPMSGINGISVNGVNGFPMNGINGISVNGVNGFPMNGVNGISKGISVNLKSPCTKTTHIH